MIDAIGWVATAIFASSYFFKQPAVLRRVQALAAALWICYGAFIHALPVVVANVVVAGLALWSSFGPPGRKPLPAAADEQPLLRRGDS
jgi:hypothetical protein